jgi:hypothetical protein
LRAALASRCQGDVITTTLPDLFSGGRTLNGVVKLGRQQPLPARAGARTLKRRAHHKPSTAQMEATTEQGMGRTETRRGGLASRSHAYDGCRVRQGRKVRLFACRGACPLHIDKQIVIELTQGLDLPASVPAGKPLIARGRAVKSSRAGGQARAQIPDRHLATQSTDLGGGFGGHDARTESSAVPPPPPDDAPISSLI